MERRAAQGVLDTASRFSSVSFLKSRKFSSIIPLTPCRAPYISCISSCFFISFIAPTRDWFITTVGPPPWAMMAFPVIFKISPFL